MRLNTDTSMKGYKTLFIFLLSYGLTANATDISPQEKRFSDHFEFAIAGIYGSQVRKLLLDAGYYFVLNKVRLTDHSYISGPTMSAAISKNSISASIGYGKLNTIQMAGAFSFQTDITHMRLWGVHDSASYEDYSGMEFKLALTIFSAKYSFMESKDNRLSYLSFGVGF